MTPDERYARCLDVLLEFEGGFSNDPDDPGGPTNKGVTLATYSLYLGRQATVQELKDIPDSHVRAIYQKYWDDVAGDKLPAGLDMMAFDAAVNCGPGRSVKWLQTASGATVDGILGPRSLQLIAAATTIYLIDDVFALRRAYYASLPTFDRFGKGWMARLTKCLTLATAWARAEG